MGNMTTVQEDWNYINGNVGNKIKDSKYQFERAKAAEVNSKILQKNKVFPYRVKIIIDALSSKIGDTWILNDLRNIKEIYTEFAGEGMGTYIQKNAADLKEYAKTKGLEFRYDKNGTSVKTKVIKIGTETCQQCIEFNKLNDDYLFRINSLEAFNEKTKQDYHSLQDNYNELEIKYKQALVKLEILKPAEMGFRMDACYFEDKLAVINLLISNCLDVGRDLTPIEMDIIQKITSKDAAMDEV
jgi:hypothetical protein